MSDEKPTDRELTTDELQSAVLSTLDHLSDVVPTMRRRELQRVLAHLVVAALSGESPDYVSKYLLKITHMLDGKFDQ